MSDKIAASWNHLASLPQRSLQELFAGDGARVDALSGRIEWPGEGGETGILFDWSKTHLDYDLIAAIFENSHVFPDLSQTAYGNYS